MDYASAIFEPMTAGITDWILPMMFTAVSSIITIMMIVVAGGLIYGVLSGGDALSMGVGDIISGIRAKLEDYGEDQEYQGILKEEKHKHHTSGLRNRARREIEDDEHIPVRGD